MTKAAPDLLERVAAALHEGWRQHYAAQGRVFGPERTPKTHPHLVPWERLDTTSQNQDRFVAAALIDEWSRGNLDRAALPRAIHEAWRRWILAQGRTHAHALPFDIAHPTGGEDHETQAAHVSPLLEAVRISR